MRNIQEIKNRRIFLFLTQRCTRNCSYCFMAKEEYSFDMPRKIRKAALEYAINNRYGAVTLIGGEPLLYPDLLECIDEVNSYGLRCSLSTAGTMDKAVLQTVLAKNLDDITVSLDSAEEQINDTMRGQEAFSTAVNTIKYALKLGADVRVTATIHQKNKNKLPELIMFLREIGVFQVDFHLMSNNGNAKALRDLGLSPAEYMLLRRELESLHLSGIGLSFPYIWVETDSEEYKNNSGYCDICERNRLSIMPNGDCFYCTLAIGEEKPHGNILRVPDEVSKQQCFFDKRGICHCEKQIETPTSTEYGYICRFIKEKVVI